MYTDMDYNNNKNSIKLYNEKHLYIFIFSCQIIENFNKIIFCKSLIFQIIYNNYYPQIYAMI